jgi:hypothetical protein
MSPGSSPEEYNTVTASMSLFSSGPLIRWQTQLQELRDSPKKQNNQESSIAKNEKPVSSVPEVVQPLLPKLSGKTLLLLMDIVVSIVVIVVEVYWRFLLPLCSRRL